MISHRFPPHDWHTTLLVFLLCAFPLFFFLWLARLTTTTRVVASVFSDKAREGGNPTSLSLRKYAPHTAVLQISARHLQLREEARNGRGRGQRRT